MHGHDALHEFHVAHEPAVVVREELDGRRGADAAWVQRGRVHVATLHQAEHLPGVSGDLQRLAVELAGERIERSHDVADRRVSVVRRVGSLGAVRLLQHAGICLGDHPLAEVHADKVLLEDVVVEHVLSGFAQVDDLLAECRRVDAVRHVLRVAGTRRVVVATNAADPAGDEMRVARILALHEDAVPTEDRRRRVALGDLAGAEVDLGVDAEASHDPRDRVPGHLDEAVGSCRLGDHLPVTSTRPCSR